MSRHYNLERKKEKRGKEPHRLTRHILEEETNTCRVVKMGEDHRRGVK